MHLFYLTLVMRWAHIIGAALLVGAPFIMWLGVYPALEKLPPDQKSSLLEAINKPWRKFLGILILTQIISGVYWLLVVENMAKEPPLYQALLGIKLLAALALFFVLAVLAGRAAAFERFRLQGRKWLKVAVALGLLAILCAGYMRLINMQQSRAGILHVQIGHAQMNISK